MGDAVAVGIDLGTTYSCVAVYRKGKVEIIPNDEGNRITPSYVAFTDTERLIGDAAKSQDAMNPTNTIFDAKRLIGRRFEDPIVQADIKNWPFEVINDNGKPKIKVQHKKEEKIFFPEQVSSMVLSKLKRTAEDYLGKPVTKAVITVPAYFNNSQRQATKDAGEIAGLTVLRIINEPAAAALAYGLGEQTDDERNVLVYDLGGGTFDVIIIIAEENIFEVKSIAGDTHLGGQDFDNRLVDHFVKEFNQKYHKDLTSSKRAICRLRKACERAKRVLSSANQANIDLHLLFDDINFHSSITRSRFEELNRDLFESTIFHVSEALREAKMQPSDIDDIVLVGGSTRIPLVQTLIKNFFNGKELNKSVHPDEVVAYGAAIQAAALDVSEELQEFPDGSEASQNFVFVNATPLSLGISAAGDAMVKLIERNSRIPKKVTKSFTTTRDNQSWVHIQVYEGERHDNKLNYLLGNFTLENLPPAPRGGCQIDVTFEIDVNSILNVTAVEKSSNISNRITIVNNKERLSQVDIKRMMEENEQYRAEDEEHRKIIEAKNKLESFCFSAKNRLNNLKDTAVLKKFDDTIRWLDTKPCVKKEEYERLLKELKILESEACS